MQADLQWLTNPAVFQVNRLDAHSDHMCCASAQEAARGETSLRQSLDGVWRFAWSRAPAARPAAFWREDFDDSAFGTILVPGHMELQGYGQIQYINSLYPWDGHAQLLPPQIDWEDNPVGSYIRTFDLDPGLRGKRVCVSFQGVEQALFLWLNGHFVGYAEDSFTPSDFDLTPYIRPTGNRLCAEVFKRSSAAWIEDQDFFRFSGIFRSVFLYAKPVVHLADLWLQAGLEEDNATGTLSVRLLLEGEGADELRCLVATKNRFGSTGEMGFFTMTETGLDSIENPSEYFVTKRKKGENVSGSAVAVLREGSRPVIAEVESLVSASFTPYPSRISETMKKDTLNTLLSILEQRGGIKLYDKNVVVKTTGGLYLKEQAANLAVLMSIASSVYDKAIPADWAFIADVGLTGELKRVPTMETRVKELDRMGFSRVFIPKGGQRNGVPEKIEVVECRFLSELLKGVFGKK